MQPTRFLCPWNSSVKNTGVGSHSFPQGIFPTKGLNQIWVSCIEGRFFIIWATREAQYITIDSSIVTNVLPLM